MVMIGMTWSIPAILFFVSIFGWEHFIGKRDLGPGECMVQVISSPCIFWVWIRIKLYFQFLKDPVFNTSLIVGYYWIPLTILIILYSFIFHAAWNLSKKSAYKVSWYEIILRKTLHESTGVQFLDIIISYGYGYNLDYYTLRYVLCSCFTLKISWIVICGIDVLQNLRFSEWHFLLNSQFINSLFV